MANKDYGKSWSGASAVVLVMQWFSDGLAALVPSQLGQLSLPSLRGR